LRRLVWLGQAKRFAFLKVGAAFGCRHADTTDGVSTAEGQEKWPGEYPEEALDCVKELYITGEDGEEVGRPNGLYTLRFGENQNVFSGTGWVMVPEFTAASYD
jgi:hypothetical protein